MAQPTTPSGSDARALALATLSFFVSFAAWGLMGGLAPVFADLYDLTASQTALLVAVPVLLGSLARLPMGMLTDRFGGRAVFTLLLLASAAAAVVVPSTWSYASLLVAAFFIGMAGSSFAVGAAFVSRWTPPARQGTALGMYGLGTLGQSLAVFGGAGDRRPLRLAERVPRHRPASWSPGRWSIVSLARNPPRPARLAGVGAMVARAAAIADGVAAGRVLLPDLRRLRRLLHLPAHAAAVAVRPVAGRRRIPRRRLRRAGHRSCGRSAAGWPTASGARRCCRGCSAAWRCSRCCWRGRRWSPSPWARSACAALLGLGNGAVFKLVPEHFPHQTGTVTGLVGALGGLGGFFPPLLLGVFRDTLGVTWPGFALLSATALALRVANQRVFRPRDVAWREALPVAARQAVERVRAGGLGDARDAAARPPPSSSARASCRTSTPRSSATPSPRCSRRSASPIATRCGSTAADAHVLAARLGGVLHAPRLGAQLSSTLGRRAGHGRSPPTGSSSGAAGCAARAQADHVGLPAGGRDHLPARVGLDSLRDRAGRPGDSTARSSSAFPMQDFPVESVIAFVLFHGLVWASFLVIAGVMLAFRRRMIDHGAVAVQQFGQDILPLVLLFAISVTGLDAHGQLHVDAGLRLRVPGHPARDHRHRHAAVPAVRQAVPHLPAARAARRRLLQGRRRARRAGALPPLRRSRSRSRMQVRGPDRSSKRAARLQLRDRAAGGALPGRLSSTAGARMFGLAQGALWRDAGRARRRSRHGRASADALGIATLRPPPVVETGARLSTSVEPERLVKTHCCFCGQQCGIQLKVRDNEVVGFEPWDEFPFNEGKLCPKGVKRYLQGSHPDRLLHPLERDRRRRAASAPIAWDAGARPRRVGDPAHPGRVRRRRLRHARRRLADQREELPDRQVRARRLQTANIDYNGRLCMVVGRRRPTRRRSASTARPTRGATSRSPTSSGSPARTSPRCSPITTSYIWRAREQRRASSSCRTRASTPIARTADLFLPVRPGTRLGAVRRRAAR